MMPASLLWPDIGNTAPEATSFTLDTAVIKDLELEKLYRLLAGDDRQYMEIEPLLRTLTYDPDVIAYRQSVLEDLLKYPELALCLEELLPCLEVLQRKHATIDDKEAELYQITRRLGELENFVHCIEKLSETFERLPEEFESSGWRSLKEFVNAFRHDAVYERLGAELPDLLARLRGIRSISIGVNLDVNLMPCEATLLAVNEERYTEGSSSIFTRLFCGSRGAGAGIAPLHRAPLKVVSRGDWKISLDPEVYGYAENPLIMPLFRDLHEIIRKTTRPIISALNQYLSVNTALLGELRQGIVFYLCARNMILALRKDGLPFCKPRILPIKDRITSVKANYNINLALSLAAVKHERLDESVVRNDVGISQDGRVLIITGPNRGGKTTYMQAVGLTHVLAQLGLFVPGEEAAISPVDGIFTHFPVEEKIDRGTGRLGDEAKRISEIFTSLTANSLFLLNESLSSTNAAEGFYIVKDILQVLCALGTRTIMTTHLLELALSIEEINRGAPPGNKIVSLVAGMIEEEDEAQGAGIRRTFRIQPGIPAANSYAREIAERYGVSFKQLSDKLRARGELR